MQLTLDIPPFERVSSSCGYEADMKDSPLKLHVADSQGQYSPATPEQILQAARDAIGQVVPTGTYMNSPDTAMAYAGARIGALDHEVFAVFFLDSQRRLIKFSEMFRGTLNQASVYPREVVKEALRCNACAVILAHNHPSGLTEPSAADRNLTRQLASALMLIDVAVKDHLIVGPGPQCYSFAQHGIL